MVRRGLDQLHLDLFAEAHVGHQVADDEAGLAVQCAGALDRHATSCRLQCAGRLCDGVASISRRPSSDFLRGRCVGEVETARGVDRDLGVPRSRIRAPLRPGDGEAAANEVVPNQLQFRSWMYMPRLEVFVGTSLITSVRVGDAALSAMALDAETRHGLRVVEIRHAG